MTLIIKCFWHSKVCMWLEQMFSLPFMGIKMRERGHLAQIQARAFENEIPRSEPNGVQLGKQSIQSSEITPLSLLYNSLIAVVGFAVFYWHEEQTSPLRKQLSSLLSIFALWLFLYSMYKAFRLKTKGDILCVAFDHFCNVLLHSAVNFWDTFNLISLV